MGVRTLFESALFIIIILLGTEHRWCEDPIESALFIIIIILLLLFSKLNRIFEGLNMLESHETLHTPQKWRKFTFDMGFKSGCGKNGSTAPPIHFQRCAPRATFHVHV